MYDNETRRKLQVIISGTVIGGKTIIVQQLVITYEQALAQV
jgi:Ni2+-binding GTPase involved in maturation of urease and hydrogenase